MEYALTMALSAIMMLGVFSLFEDMASRIIDQFVSWTTMIH